MRWLTVMLLAISLTGCGAASKTIVSEQVGGPKDVVMTAVAKAELGEAAALFPGMTFQRTQPAPDQLKFVVPGSNGNNASILFTFSAMDSGKAAQVSAELDIPALVVTINGQRKVLSAQRVASSLRKTLRAYDRRGDARSVTNDMSQMLFALAIGTNDSFRDRAMALRDSPSSAMADMFDEDEAMDDENAPEAMAVNDNEPPSIDPPAEEREVQPAESAPENAAESEREQEPAE